MVRDNSVLKQVLEKKKILEAPFYISSWDKGQRFRRDVHHGGQGRVRPLPRHWSVPHGAVLHPTFPMAGTDEEEKGSGAFGYKVPKLGIKKPKCYFKTAG